MGSKPIVRTAGSVKSKILPGPGPVAQVAHPMSLKWDPQTAIDTLLAASQKVPGDVQLLVTGGGYIMLKYPKTSHSDADLRQPEFLAKLHGWTLDKLSGAPRAIGHAPERDLIIGIDVAVNGLGPGQFALWVGRGGSALVPKRFPVDDEADYLAGVGLPTARALSTGGHHAARAHAALGLSRRAGVQPP